MAHQRLARTAKAHAIRAIVLAWVAVSAPYIIILLTIRNLFRSSVPIEAWAIVAAAIVASAATIALIPLNRIGQKIVDDLIGDDARGRLRNVAEEISIAIGEPTERVMIHDSSIPNVGAFPTFDGAVVIATQGAIEVLRRDELEALVAAQLAGMRDGWCRLATRAELGWTLARVLGFVSILFSPPLGIFVSIALIAFPRIVEATRDLCADVAAITATRHPEALAGALHDLANAADESHRQRLVSRWYLPVSTFLVLPKRMQSTKSVRTGNRPKRTWTSVEEVAFELHLRADRAEALAAGADPRAYTGREYRRRWSRLGTLTRGND